MMRAVRSEELYEAVFDPERYTALPALIARIGGGRSALMHWRHEDGSDELLGASGLAEDQMARYVESFVPLDPWQAVISVPGRQNRFLDTARYVPDAALEKSVFYNELIRGMGDDSFRCIGAGYASRWGMGAIGVHRGRAQAPFAPEDVARLESYSVHLQRVLATRGELAAASQRSRVANDAIDQFSAGVILVGAGGRVMQMNSAAEEIVNRADALQFRAGALTALKSAAAACLAMIIGEATRAHEPTGGHMMLARDGMKAYMLSVVPLASPGRPAAAMMVLRDPEIADSPTAERLRAFFNLTLIEAGMAIDISQGRTPAQIASERGVKLSTVKTQLLSLAAKMGCTRQAQIAAIVARLPAIRS